MTRRNTPYGSSLRWALALARWDSRQAGRELIGDAVGTLQGRLMLATSVVALPGLVQLVRAGGPLGELGLTEPARLGALLVGQAGLCLCLFVMVPVLTAKGLVLGRAEDPIFGQGGFVPEAAVLRATRAVLGGSVFLFAFFVLFHGRLFPLASAEGLLGPAALFAAVLAQLMIFGTFTAVATRRFLASPQGLSRARMLRNSSVVPFFVAFPSLVYLPVLIHRRAPERLEEVGLLAASSASNLSTAVACIALTVAGLLGSGWVMSRWLDMSPAELCCPQGAAAPADGRRRVPLPPSFRGRPTLVPLFLWKDVIFEGARRPLAYLRRHGLLVAGTCLLGLQMTGPAVILAVSAALTAPSLGSLGREGRAYALLRPVLSPRRFFTIKWAVGAIYACAHLPLYALTLALLTRGAGVAMGDLVWQASLGVLGCIGFSLLGTSLGFLLPDPACRSTLIPGASRSGLLAYSLTAAPTVAFAVRGVARLGEMPG